MEEDMITLEAALYVSGRALTLEELSNIIGKSQSTVQKLLDELGFEIPGGLLSYATLQTLVIIAIKQPIIQSVLVTERGTHCYDHVKELIEKKFVEAVPEGRSKTLTTTPLFADYFGLDSDRIKLKAQLKFKLKRILSEQQELEEKITSQS
jgi:segregation and condensation protein B